jgi:AraC-like DNA-binding protein
VLPDTRLARPTNPALERHWSIQEIATTWNLSKQTVTKYFQDEPGVLKHANTPTRKRRTYATLRVPESVLIRVHTRLKQ